MQLKNMHTAPHPDGCGAACVYRYKESPGAVRLTAPGFEKRGKRKMKLIQLHFYYIRGILSKKAWIY